MFLLSESVIQFEKTKFSVKEPQLKGETEVLRIPVRRIGDLSHTSVVRVHTRDGSAKAGRDYHGFSKGKMLNKRDMCFKSY